MNLFLIIAAIFVVTEAINPEVDKVKKIQKEEVVDRRGGPSLCSTTSCRAGHTPPRTRVLYLCGTSIHVLPCQRETPSLLPCPSIACNAPECLWLVLHTSLAVYRALPTRSTLRGLPSGHQTCPMNFVRARCRRSIHN